MRIARSFFKSSDNLFFGSIFSHAFHCGLLFSLCHLLIRRAEYHGEVITELEGNLRGKVYDLLNRSYLFDTNAEEMIDSSRVGNAIKFTNHDGKVRAKGWPLIISHTAHLWWLYSCLRRFCFRFRHIQFPLNPTLRGKRYHFLNFCALVVHYFYHPPPHTRRRPRVRRASASSTARTASASTRAATWRPAKRSRSTTR